MTPRRLGKHIIAEVAAEYGVTPADIIGRSKTRKVVEPRQVAMRRVRAELGYPYLLMARIFRRDHSTIVWAVRGSKKNPRQEAA